MLTPERLAEIEGYLADDRRKQLSITLWDTDIIGELIAHIRDLEAQLAAARETLEKIWNMGHNDDCIFCGLKDSVAVKWMPQPEVWQAENPTATPPSPEVGE